ncbi:hypothetical protein FEM48_Zijuj04G0055600 [Ziziphus jujuba var. spinosa]|uniref:Uncharacterized protein n=1 Tax=Ziziphus jujuba var. spinosa TaxID=714518 RepID=A0A978VI34_ZIZJJ|nr:hypothetical protein FEM48_Zijuj04G0055600 [Ziziphus jujuba var. spinosa]
MKGEDEVPFFNYSEHEGKFTCGWEHTSELKSGATKTTSSEHSSETNQYIKGMSGTVFSEINNPQAFRGSIFSYLAVSDTTVHYLLILHELKGDVLKQEQSCLSKVHFNSTLAIAILCFWPCDNFNQQYN